MAYANGNAYRLRELLVGQHAAGGAKSAELAAQLGLTNAGVHRLLSVMVANGLAKVGHLPTSGKGPGINVYAPCGHDDDMARVFGKKPEPDLDTRDHLPRVSSIWELAAMVGDTQ